MQFEPPTKPTDVAVSINGAGDSSAPGTDQNGIVTGRWKTGLFSCFDALIPNAVMAFCCPALSVAQIAARVGMMPFKHVLWAFGGLYFLAFLAAVGGDFFEVLFWLAAIVAAVCIFRMRMRLRIALSIPGSPLEDLASSVCCGCCAIAQMATHVESYEAGTFTFAPRETLPGYSFN